MNNDPDDFLNMGAIRNYSSPIFLDLTALARAIVVNLCLIVR